MAKKAKYNKKELAALAKDWDDAEDQDVELPDGDYHVLIQSCKLTCEPGKRRQAVTNCKVISGDEDFIGNEVTFFDGLESAQNIGYFKKKLSRAKIALGEGAEGLIEALEEFEGRLVEMRIKNKDGFTNAYVNKLIKAEYDEDEDDDDDDDDDDDTDVDDDDDDDNDDTDDDDDNDDDEERVFPEQDVLTKLNQVKAAKKLERLFKGADASKAPKKAKAVLQLLVAIQEGDEYEGEENDERLAAKCLGLRLKKSMDAEAVEKLLEGKLNEIFK